MFVVPTAWAVTRPLTTVAAVELLVFHVAVSVIFTTPLHVVALAVNCCVFGVLEALSVTGPAGTNVIDSMQPTLTVTVCDPVMVGFTLEVAVIDEVPVLTEVTNPEPLTVAMLGSALLQATDGLAVLPSLYVPMAVICTVLSVLPVSIVGVAGPTAIVLSVG
jgi:hypothetical protein